MGKPELRELLRKSLSKIKTLKEQLKHEGKDSSNTHAAYNSLKAAHDEAIDTIAEKEQSLKKLKTKVRLARMIT